MHRSEICIAISSSLGNLVSTFELEYKRIMQKIFFYVDRIINMLNLANDFIFILTESEGSSPTTIVALCKGRFYWFNGVDDDELPLTAPEYQLQLQRVIDRSNELGEGPGVGALSGDDRVQWAQVGRLNNMLGERLGVDRTLWA